MSAQGKPMNAAPPTREPLRVLMVCTGNICRSPSAEAILRAQVQEAGLEEWIHIDSAGTHDWHTGKPPHGPSIAHAKRRGYDLSALRGRPVRPADFHDFDWIIAMDRGHLAWLKAQAPRNSRAQLATQLSLTPEHGADVPDPYGLSAADFEQVLDLLEASMPKWVERLRGELGR